MPERVFRAIIPKRDNSDQPIKASALESLASELIERFGGVTVYPAAMGCFKMEEGDVVCEENIVVETVFQIVTDPKQQVEGCGGTLDQWEQVDQQNKFMRTWANKAAKRLGQEAIFIQEETDTRTGFHGGFSKTVKRKLPPHMIGDENQRLWNKIIL